MLDDEVLCAIQLGNNLPGFRLANMVETDFLFAGPTTKSRLSFE